MGFDGQSHAIDLATITPTMEEIEARVTRAERIVEARERGTACKVITLEDRIDRNHAELMDALGKQELALRNEVLRRLQKIERKLQIVA